MADLITVFPRHQFGSNGCCNWRFCQAAAQRTDSRLLTCFLRNAALLFTMFDNANSRLQIGSAATARRRKPTLGVSLALMSATMVDLSKAGLNHTVRALQPMMKVVSARGGRFSQINTGTWYYCS